MKPSNIMGLINAASELQETNRDPMAALLIAWAAWEAMRMRLLRVVVKRKGWTVRDAQAVLRVARVSLNTVDLRCIWSGIVGCASVWVGEVCFW